MIRGNVFTINNSKAMLAGSWAYKSLENKDEENIGLIHVPPEYFGFIRLFERNRRVSVYVNDIEGLAKVCEQELNKKLEKFKKPEHSTRNDQISKILQKEKSRH